jgi:hypothetical protein
MTGLPAQWHHLDEGFPALVFGLHERGVDRGNSLLT